MSVCDWVLSLIRGAQHMQVYINSTHLLSAQHNKLLFFINEKKNVFEAIEKRF